MSESLVLRPNTREIAALWRPVGPHRSSTFIFLTCSSSFSLAFTNHRMLFDSSPRYPASLKAQTTKGGSSMLLSRIYTQLFSTIYTFACRQWYRQHSRITLISRDKHHCNSSPPFPSTDLSPPMLFLRDFDTWLIADFFHLPTPWNFSRDIHHFCFLLLFLSSLLLLCLFFFFLSFLQFQCLHNLEVE